MWTGLELHKRGGIEMWCKFFIVFLLLSMVLSLQAGLLHERVEASIDHNTLFQGNQYYGGQIAVTVAPYLGGDDVILIAVSGGDFIRLFKYDDDTSTITHLRPDILVSDEYYAWDISFLELPMGESGDAHWCLVIPKMYFGSSYNPGQIDVLDIETREFYENCWSDFNPHDPVQMYHMADIGDGCYSLSASNEIYFCSFNSLTHKFEEINHPLVPGGTFYGASATRGGGRTYETQDYSYDYNQSPGTACITTMHNAGVLIWDPETKVELSRIGVGQQSVVLEESYIENGYTVVDGELGDVHRAAVLNGGNIAVPGSQPILSRLLFFGNHTMGFMIYDISIPTAPQFVWQWDHDTRLGFSVEEFGWSGAGCNDQPIPPQNDPDYGLFPGCVFGIGLRVGADESIHLYVADAREGLLSFNFSDFLHPFMPFGMGRESYRTVSINQEASYTPPNSSSEFSAYDLRTLQLSDANTLVFTSWKIYNDVDAPDNWIGVSVHSSESVRGSNIALESELTVSSDEFDMEYLSSNPAFDSQRIRFYGCSQTVELLIYDAAGRLIEEQVIEANRGQAEFSWDCISSTGNRLPSGAYYLRAESGDQSITSSVILLD